MNWWALSNASSIMWICSAIHEILANKDFTVTDDLISQLFVVAFVYLTYEWIALIWGFPVQLSLWKSVYWLWRYKLNEVCDTCISYLLCLVSSTCNFSSAYHVVVEFSLLFFLLTLYCFLKDTSCISHGLSLYSYRYSPVSLCFTNWLPSFLLTQFALVATWAKLKIR